MTLARLSAGERVLPIRRLLLLSAATVAALSALCFATPALAEGAPGGTSGASVSWSVSPADTSGADGRHAIEHEVEAGQRVEEHIVVRNLGESDVVFALSAADGFITPTGRFDMLPSSRESTDSGTWITLPQQVEVGAGASAVVPFTITVPADAEPGDHAAGVAASVMSVGAAGSAGAGVGVESRVGVKVLTRVMGEIAPSFAVDDVRAEYDGQANPFKAGALTVTFTVHNTGNARLAAAGEVKIAGQSVAFPGDGELSPALLPGDSRKYTVAVPHVWPLVFLTGELSVTPQAASFGGEPVQLEHMTQAVTAWAVPWSQLLSVAGVALVVVALIGGKIRSRRRVEGLISAAVERGREEAQNEARKDAAWGDIETVQADEPSATSAGQNRGKR